MSIYSYLCTINLGGIPISFELEYKDSSIFFQPFDITFSEASPRLAVSEEYWEYMQKQGFTRCGQIEASILTALASDALLSFNRFIIHAVAFSFRGKAWLISAAPSVGKSTQIRYLMDYYPGEFSVICGDRPVIELRDEGDVIVHPSPWNGKEKWFGAEEAPLEGILCLYRGNETKIRRLRPREAVIPIYTSLISTRETEEIIKALSRMETDLIKTVPIYEYINGGVPDSTRILYRFLSEGRSDR